MNNSIDFEGLNAALLAKSTALVHTWLPGGTLHGAEYATASLKGGQGKSLKVNIHTGLWADFATGETGSDLISLYAGINGTRQIDAARALISEAGGGSFEVQKVPHSNKPKKATPVSPIIASIPTGETPPVNKSIFIHKEHGKPTKVWQYKNRAGHPIFYVARYDPADGKEFRAISFQNNKWVAKNYKNNRPLYGLETLSDENQSVLIVEGEKAADAARILTNNLYQVVTWPGGGNACKPKFVDWSPIYGKKILIWPDNDEAGIKTAGIIAHHLLDHCPGVRVLGVQNTDIGQKFDAADALEEGWTYNQWLAWARPILRDITNQVEEASPPIQELPPIHEPPPEYTEAIPINGIPIDGHAPLFEQWGQWGVTVGANGSPKNNVDTAFKMISNYPGLKDTFWFDEFTCIHMVQWPGEEPRQRKDTDETKVCIMLQSELGYHNSTAKIVKEALNLHCELNTRNGFKDYIHGLKWDGVDRVTLFMEEAMGAIGRDAEESLYFAQVSNSFWLSLIKRPFEPGCKLDTMVIFEGHQGSGKSTALDIIGGQWFAEAMEQMGSKDFALALTGILLTEIPELASMSKTEINKAKQVMSCRSDKFRKPYAATVTDNPRMGIMAGTTNEYNYLKDATGGRRFLPVRTSKIDLEYVTKFRDQFFAEAFDMYKRGMNHDCVDYDLAQKQQDRRYDEDIWTDHIEGFVRRNFDHEITTINILTKCLDIEVGKIKQSDKIRVTKIMTKMGRTNKRIRYNDARIYAWVEDEG